MVIDTLGAIRFVGSSTIAKAFIGAQILPSLYPSTKLLLPSSSFTGRQSKVIDFEGKLILPGFIDSHIHPVESGVEYFGSEQSPLFASLRVDSFDEL